MSCPPGKTIELCKSLAGSGVAEVSQGLPSTLLGALMGRPGADSALYARDFFEQIITLDEPAVTKKGKRMRGVRLKYMVTVRRFGDSEFRCRALKNVIYGRGRGDDLTEIWTALEKDDPHPEFQAQAEQLMEQFQGIYREVNARIEAEINRAFLETGDLPPAIKSIASRLAGFERLRYFVDQYQPALKKASYAHRNARNRVADFPGDPDAKAEYQRTHDALAAAIDEAVGIEPHHSGVIADVLRATRDYAIDDASRDNQVIEAFLLRLPIEVARFLYNEDTVILSPAERIDLLGEVVVSRVDDIPLEFLVKRPELLAKVGL